MGADLVPGEAGGIAIEVNARIASTVRHDLAGSSSRGARAHGSWGAMDLHGSMDGEMLGGTAAREHGGKGAEENGSAHTDQLQPPAMTARTGLGGQTLGGGGDNFGPPIPSQRHPPRVTTTGSKLFTAEFAESAEPASVGPSLSLRAPRSLRQN